MESLVLLTFGLLLCEAQSQIYLFPGSLSADRRCASQGCDSAACEPCGLGLTNIAPIPHPICAGPQFSCSSSQIPCGSSQFTYACPQIPCAGPQISCAGPQISCAGQQFSCAGPQIPCAGPQISCPGPQIPCAGPQISCAGPQISCGGQQISCAGPQISCPRQQNSCSGPQNSCAGPPISCAGPQISGADLKIPCTSPQINNVPVLSFTPNQLPCSFPKLPPLMPSCSQPILNVPQLTPSLINLAPAPTISTCATTPVAQTIVDNSLANSLANTIQLLIVSNLIENTLGSSCTGNSGSLVKSPCANTFEVISDICDPIDYPCCNEVAPCFQEVCQPACVDIAPCAGNLSPMLESGPCGFDCACGPQVIESCNPFGSFGPGLPQFGCSEMAGPPMAIEVPFPASIPALLNCNFGFSCNNVPCVNVNVEPVPFNNCKNMFGNGYFC